MPQKKVTLEEVRKLFYKLYCFKSEEIEKYMVSAERMPQEALSNLYKALQEGKEEQDALLAKRIVNEENFLNEMTRYLETATKKIKQDYEETEAEKAEEILKDV